MRIFLLTIVFLMPLAMPAQTDTTMQKNNIEVLKAEAVRKAAEAKGAAGSWKIAGRRPRVPPCREIILCSIIKARR